MADQRNRNRQRQTNEIAEEKQFDERTVQVDRVARVVKGGRRFRFRALVVVGDHKNRIGVGSAKGADVTAAVTKATDVAKKHLVSINLYKGTLPHDSQSKVSGAKILLKPASPGTGIIAGGVVRTVLEVAGVSNALSKSLGSSNKTNLAYATVEALKSLKPADQWVTRMNTKPKTTKPTPEPAAKATPKPKVVKTVKKATTTKEAKS